MFPIIRSLIFFVSAFLLSNQFLLGSQVVPDAIVMIPMRDNVQLPTSFYFPDGKVGKYPCVLVRHPLGREHIDNEWLALLQEGYVVAIQSTRSACDVTGKDLPYITDGWGELADGYDTIEWLAHCDWTDGKIATIGTSATGITQFLLAPSQPPHLVCQHIEMAAPSLYQYAIRPGGQLRKEQVEGWLKTQKRDHSVITWLSQESRYTPFWDQFNAIQQANRVTIPQAHIGGWYDIFLQGTIDAFVQAQQLSSDSCRDQHKLVIGPWIHRMKNPNIPFGDFHTISKGKEPPQLLSCKEWLNFHMKKRDNSLKEVPAIQYYVMGPFDGTSSIGNQWRSAHKWPPRASTARLYLTQEYFLQPTEEAIKEAKINVLFDAHNPVPTVGGRNLFIAAGPKDLRAIEARPDVISFTTQELKEDTEITGPITACLFASHVFQERDLCCRLTDVYPDGKSILIAEGVSHICPKDTVQNKSQTQKNVQDGLQNEYSPEQVVVDLWSTSMVFAKGHRIRLTISGSNFPAFEKSLLPNPSTTSDGANICFSLHSGGNYASYLALPIISGDQSVFAS